VTTATGIDVTGTVTADGLTVSASAATANITSTSGGATLNLTHPTATDGYSIRQGNANADDFRIFEGSKIKLNITTGGDISFYEDTGTTPKFFWDASAESLGIGTISPNYNLQIDDASSATLQLKDLSDSGTASIFFADATQNTPGFIQYDNSGDYFRFGTNGSERVRIDSSGQVGIGTTSPAAPLSISGSSTGEYDALILRNSNAAASGQSAAMIFEASAGTSGDEASSVAKISGLRTGSGSKGDLLFHTTLAGVSSEAMRIDSSGALLLNPNNATRGLKITTTQTTAVGDTTTYDTIGAGYGRHIFKTDGTEAARIDSSGNLLVGKTSTGAATAGIELNGANDVLRIARDGGVLQELNRITSDGDIIDFRKDNVSVGSIGVVNTNNIRIGGVVADHAGLQFGTNILIPETAGTASDGLVDIGTGANRYQDVYATNGTIQTSDGNEKQDIEALSDAEQRVAVAAKGLLRKFRWKSAVEAKGDEARTHFGIIAQDLQAAFAAEGLDAGDYGMFINSTWTDEETGEERSRMGVRYSELLAFIISAI
jgi:hypothetical protein